MTMYPCKPEFLSDNVISDNVSHNYDTDSEIENQQINTVADVHEYYVLDHTMLRCLQL